MFPQLPIQAPILYRFADVRVTTVGKIDDLFPGSPITDACHVENNRDAEAAVLRAAREPGPRLVFANLIDFDMLYGHRRDAAGYAAALQRTDEFLGRLVPMLTAGDLLIVTADHGNDPTFPGTDHTRELVPLLALQPGAPGLPLGIRQGFYDVAQSLAAFFGAPPAPRGTDFFAAEPR